MIQVTQLSCGISYSEVTYPLKLLRDYMAPGTPAQGNPVFTSWKEIAAYLGKGVRTVQRWESRFGLPVRRPTPGSHSVYISRDELNEWLVKRWSERPKNLRIPIPLNGAKAGKAGIENHRELCGTCHQLIGEVRRNMQSLAELCQTLSRLMTHSRTLVSQVIPLLSDQSASASPTANQAQKSPRKRG